MRRIYGLPRDNRDQAARYLTERGFDAVTVGVDEDAVSVKPARDAGLRVWRCRAAFSVRHLSDADKAPLLARDVDGEPRLWFGSGCPNEKAIRDDHLDQVRRTVEAGPFDGWLLDGIRFASPNAGDAFFTCFCARCERKAAQLGFDFHAMRRDVRALRDWCRTSDAQPLATNPEDLVAPLVTRWPGTAEWLRFREACVREHVGEVRAVIDAANLRGKRFQLGAYLFFPSIAPLVGQDYPQLGALLDQVSPMLYRTLTPGDSCLTTEWGALAALHLITPHDTFAPRDVGQQVRLARERLGGQASLVPILQLADERLEETMEAARLGGAGGMDFFRYRPGEERYVEIASRGTRARI
ncbi:MAG TPA: hypothetical protein VFN74_18515 [Chloroflexota bacterium]|nr:hypothetical protein [Chloroflexota bacterium]